MFSLSAIGVAVVVFLVEERLSLGRRKKKKKTSSVYKFADLLRLTEWAYYNTLQVCTEITLAKITGFRFFFQNENKNSYLQ